ncbi:hypothetical protein A946_06530 [Methylacidiphilum kamchatkense Kam1]|uniref:Uncharacterized protein n=1 Tax=Methylacidiphilum kamchatkense Kam1 TaxID=1202785 RepID=A0A0C1RKE7_9BACT|nr:hypothetical protein [Methylacidiphilum kamchatkense]KIE58537.1 hypothetical protein A946_06530 [Methylacidiphilum kamchatkense Kam1]QDQ43359.1 hypothetical protein kam1_2151 [Methylacidiphilum kamchatkense Kam1]
MNLFVFESHRYQLILHGMDEMRLTNWKEGIKRVEKPIQDISQHLTLISTQFFLLLYRFVSVQYLKRKRITPIGGQYFVHDCGNCSILPRVPFQTEAERIFLIVANIFGRHTFSREIFNSQPHREQPFQSIGRIRKNKRLMQWETYFRPNKNKDLF